MGVLSDRIGFHRSLQESCHIMNDRHFGACFLFTSMKKDYYSSRLFVYFCNSLYLLY